MTQLTPQQKRKLEKLVKIVAEGNVAIAEYLYELEQKLDSEIPGMKDVLLKIKGDKGDSPTKEELLNLIQPLIVIPEPIHGKDYVLTEEDKEEIAKSITVPVVEKVIEKTEIIKEQPLFFNKIEKEIIKEDKETPEQIRDKLETLENENRLDAKAIKGLDDVGILKKNLEIIDSRTRNIGGGNVEVYSNGNKIGTGTGINFIGSGIQSISHDGHRVTVNISGGSGTGFTKETPTGDVNSVNQVFTVTNEPNYVVSDGATYFDGAGYTYSSLTITMDSPPSQYIRSYF
jgi:hypothetical protein